jgi:predicted amidohydrolase YtcJ
MAVAAAALAVTAAVAVPAQDPLLNGLTADLIVHNATIYTVDAARPTAEAIAVRGGRIARVGSNAAVLAARGPATRLIDLAGATVVPGLQDAHGHVGGLGSMLQTLDFRGTTSFEQVVARVRQRVASTPRGEWILGRGWDQNDWRDTAWPTHELLSAVAPEHPVYLTRVDGHAALVNRKALELAGVSKSTTDPEGGRILRDAAGEPTGVLIDRADGLVSSRMPTPGPAQLEERLLLADQEFRRLGLTMVHDAGTDAATVDAYRRLIDAGRLKTRVYVMVQGTLPSLAPVFASGPLTGGDRARLFVRAIKVVADGALGSRGAAMLEPYADEPATTGLLTTPPEEVYVQTLAASKAGFQTAIHAIGDRGNRVAMDVFERVQREVPAARALRLRIEHAQILDSAEIPRFARLGIIASMQATHATSDMPWVADRIGAARVAEGAYLWQTLLRSGVVLANGSDFPVEEANPMLGLYAAVTRQDPSGRPPGGWMPDQRLSREQALRSFTWSAAYAAHAESLVGSLETGKLADFVVLSKDVMHVPQREILETTVRMTVIGGEIVYDQTQRQQRK